MKTKVISWISIISISVFGFISCDTDEKDDYIINAESLKQTTWEGTEIVTDGDQVISTYDVLIQFFTVDSGQSILKEEGSDAFVYDFNYSIEGKIINIDGGPLSSKRTLLDVQAESMVLEAFGSYKCTLTLHKKY